MLKIDQNIQLENSIMESNCRQFRSIYNRWQLLTQKEKKKVQVNVKLYSWVKQHWNSSTHTQSQHQNSFAILSLPTLSYCFQFSQDFCHRTEIPNPVKKSAPSFLDTLGTCSQGYRRKISIHLFLLVRILPPATHWRREVLYRALEYMNFQSIIP